MDDRKSRLLQTVRDSEEFERRGSEMVAQLHSSLPPHYPLPSDSDVRLLHLAIAENKLDLVQRLLRQFPSVCLHSHFGETPLINALRSGHEEMALLLIEHGADVNCKKVVFDAAKLGKDNRVDWYEVTARQMAYDNRMMRALEAIDFITGNFFTHLPKPTLPFRMCRPKLPSPADLEPLIPANFFSDDFASLAPMAPAEPTQSRRRRGRPSLTNEPVADYSSAGKGKPAKAERVRPQARKGRNGTKHRLSSSMVPP